MRVELGVPADIPEGRPKCVTANGRKLSVFNVNGTVFCLDNACTHVGGPLCEGRLDGFVIQCPWHGSRFDVRDGTVVHAPARAPVKSYPITIEGGKLWADVP